MQNCRVIHQVIELFYCSQKIHVFLCNPFHFSLCQKLKCSSVGGQTEFKSPCVFDYKWVCLSLLTNYFGIFSNVWRKIDSQLVQGDNFLYVSWIELTHHYGVYIGSILTHVYNGMTLRDVLSSILTWIHRIDNRPI